MSEKQILEIEAERDFLEQCKVARCPDYIFKKRLEKSYPLLAPYKAKNISWKKFYMACIHDISIIKETGETPELEKEIQQMEKDYSQKTCSKPSAYSTFIKIANMLAKGSLVLGLYVGTTLGMMQLLVIYASNITNLHPEFSVMDYDAKIITAVDHIFKNCLRMAGSGIIEWTMGARFRV